MSTTATIPTADACAGLLKTLAAQGDAPALLGAGGTGCSFAELAATLARAADWFSDLGPGQAVLTLLPDDPTTATAIVAGCLGATVVPANPALKPVEIEALARAARVRWILVREPDGAVADLARRLALGVIVLAPRPHRHGADFDLAMRAAPKPGGPAGRDGADTAIVLSTSGSTGAPKLVPLGLEALIGSARTIARTLALGPQDTAVHGLPMFHIGAVVDLFLAPLLAGGRVRFQHPFSAEAALAAIEEAQATWIQAVPTMLHALVGALPPERLTEIGRSLRFIRSVSADLSPERQARVEKSFGGVPVIQMYGMTETAGQICSNPLPPGTRKPGSVGRPDGAEIAILDRFANPVVQGRVGEVCVRGPSVMAGYLDTDNADHFHGSWLRTGDLGFLDADGFLVLSGRLKDMINRGGEKIPVLEIEQGLEALDGVAQGACVPVPHPSLGEEVGAVVLRAPGARLTADDMRAGLQGRLADFKIPRKIAFVDRMPRLASGKLDRQALAATFAADGPGRDRAPETPAPAASALGQTIARVWSKVLDTPPPRPSDDFFDAGGDSLAAQTFMMLLEERLGRPMPTNLLYEAPTFAELERALDDPAPEDGASAPASDLPAEIFRAAKHGMAGWRGTRRHARSLIVALREVGEKTPFFFCTPTETSFVDLVGAMDANRPFFAMRTLWLQENRTARNEALLARHYALEIDDLRPDGAIVLGGHCRGVEMARMVGDALAAMGRRVGLLVEIDYPIDDVYSGRVAQIWSNDHPLSWDFSEPERWNDHHYAGPVAIKRLDVPHGDITRGGNAETVAAFIDARMDDAGLPAAATAQDAAALARRVADRRARLHRADVDFSAPKFATRGETIEVPVTLTNTSRDVWEPSARSGLRLLAKWRRPGGKPLRMIAARRDLDRAVAPGETVRLSMAVPFHDHTTPLFLCIDMVDEGIGWFHESDGQLARRLIVPRYWRASRS